MTVANVILLKECCICLSAYEDGSELRELPCRHHFHCGCIDKWLYINAICPLCKFNILKSQNQSGSDIAWRILGFFEGDGSLTIQLNCVVNKLIEPVFIGIGHDQYKMKDLGKVDTILGIKAKQNSRGFELYQSYY